MRQDLIIKLKPEHGLTLGYQAPGQQLICSPAAVPRRKHGYQVQSVRMEQATGRYNVGRVIVRPIEYFSISCITVVDLVQHRTLFCTTRLIRASNVK